MIISGTILSYSIKHSTKVLLLCVVTSGSPGLMKDLKMAE